MDFLSSLSKMNTNFVQVVCGILRILKKIKVLSQRWLHEEEDQKMGALSDKSDDRVQQRAKEPLKGTVIK